MGTVSSWSTTAGNNNSASPDGAPEGMAASGVNNTIRENMAQIRTWYNDAEWIEYGDGDGAYTAAYAAANQFTIASTDVTSVYHVGRRIKLIATTPGTIYGTVTAVSFSTNTTVTVAWDEGAVLSNEAITNVYVGVVSGESTSLPSRFAGHNFLHNPDFRIAGRGTSFTSATTPANSNDTYLFDRWVLLSDGNDRADITQETSVVPTDGYAAIKFDVETVSGTSEKFGIVQILEAKDAAYLDGKTVTFSFQARTTSGQVENLRAHVLSWDSTADSVTSDVVSAWGAEGSNPTFAANWTAENTAANLSLTNAYQQFSVKATIDTASMTNIAVFIHVDDTDLVATDVLYITNCKLEIGDSPTDYAAQSYDYESARCKRFYERLNYDVASDQIIAIAHMGTTSAASAVVYYAEKRSNPTLTFTAAGTFDFVDAANTPGNVTSISTGTAGKKSASLTIGFGALTQGVGYLRRDATDTCYIEVGADL